ncbi:hypothetical protein A2130_00390 [Candidatus Woesebacteria bacterium GWC2_33_12]|uniref:CxxC-x17-CxxC domain-containing protein n=1 Tax=Candidatus Woesebacteria bacterium GW2011_GWB1_33_22 TaxID=1618566 RepID=A0A0F9ZYC0_9BACT|nr:MAG: hypothetical protein UR29_C0008G0026 [Candidatus Woesebacteria bacterium GW2011_GWC2_33_12]KKP41528.1 MAG: hypothetical protein UR33_C0013G0006 [Candidatus Woesebacteria bacterium GW2011_GWA2_33_20]KKP43981.1 MAG: hypothetical protein UR35_C0013G0006 [Candidatus Woesebacteria bacterium GW2011_GWB1_33_22]KKP46578.1 MAG: hypothetical protein UR37_C0006G0028 [Microgenomates group bacterium GW2011_GWC1_33_28]KKP49459.1 MAG: hypothetical protein UR41_C0014G0006 [Candidatus Woesebacteria bact
MGYFNRDDSRGGGNSRGGGRSFGGGGRSSFGGRNSGGRDDRPREMFKTVCSNCGKDCEVPFRPTSGKPVYCSDCFEKVGGRNSIGDRPERNDRPSFDRPQAPRNDNNKQFSDLNAKLDKIIELLTPKVKVIKPEKPVKAPKAKKAKEVVEK